jgi:8-oxo-dGTP diphosphatase
MQMATYTSNVKKSLQPGTLCFFFKQDSILLGMKKEGFGKGKWLGIGGKVGPNESIDEAAIREVQEEIFCSVDRSELKKVGVINFYFPHIADESWNQRVHIFTTHKWAGEPKESTEIRPQWFQITDIPYYSMWDDAKFWLPAVIKGGDVTADFIFDESLRVIDHKIE